MGPNPTNTNLAQPSKFLLSFDRLPYLTYFCTKANIPGITSGEATQTTPFIDAPIPGDKMVYDTFDVHFLIDEPLYSWTTIQDWIKGFTFPENFDQYKNLSMQQKIQMGYKGNKAQYSDALMTIMSNKNNAILQVKFVDVFPVSLGSIQFDTSQSALDVITAQVSFKFTNYDILRL